MDRPDGPSTGVPQTLRSGVVAQLALENLAVGVLRQALEAGVGGERERDVARAEEEADLLGAGITAG